MRVSEDDGTNKVAHQAIFNVMLAIKKLPAIEREVIIAYYLNEETIPDIALEAGVKNSDILEIHKEARKRLVQLTQSFYEDIKDGCQERKEA